MGDPLNELQQLHAWLRERLPHSVFPVTRLPDPTFESQGKPLVSFSSNNYLGFATSPRLIAAAKRGLDQYGVGNCESRLLGGDLDIYHQLESRIATLKGRPAAILFITGYLTNLGVLSSLPRLNLIARFYGYRPRNRAEYAYFTDECNHMSIREGIRCSEVEKVTYHHCDMNHLEDCLKASSADIRIIASDGVFSQDGDIAPLPQLLDLADRYDALVYLDDAHGTGILGPNGGGTMEHYNIDSPRLICMGTLSKAYGAIGGFIASEHYLVDLLRFGCSAYSFTSTLPPDQAVAVLEAINMVTDEPARRQRLWENQRYFVSRMDALGFPLLARETPIVPMLIGDEAACESLSQLLAARGYHVDSIVFPAVAKNRARLRFMMNANHTREQIDGLLDVLVEQAQSTRPRHVA